MRDYYALPSTLQSGSFCIWRYEERDGKKTKVPYDPRTGKRGRSNDQSMFSDFETAVAASAGYDGIGVGLFGDLVAIDIDHCIVDGKKSPIAVDIMQHIQTYTEVSPSGSGLHLIGRAGGFRYNKNEYYTNNTRIGLEVYVAGQTNKYITVTGDRLNGCDLADISGVLQWLLDQYMRKKTAADNIVNQQTSTYDISDAYLLETIRTSKQGTKFQALWNGDISGYASHSNADLALCSILAFWTDRDPRRMDSLFRRSGLYRDKWEREDYRTATIAKAISGCSEGYKQVKEAKKQMDKESTRTILDALVSFNSIDETEVDWLLPLRIPRGEITVIGADGGSGKGFLVSDIISSISSGTGGILYEADNIPSTFPDDKDQKILFFSSEDDASKVLKGRLRVCNANMRNVVTITESEALKDIKFNSAELASIIETLKPALCVFDPIQSFLPPSVNMGARNEMRDCLNALVGLAHKHGTAFIIVSHTNKKQNVYGRQRLSDSSDLWDIARSVFLCGTTKEGYKYLSHEKSNYGKLAKTILFTIQDYDGVGRAVFAGITDKKDKDFIAEDYRARQNGSTADETKEFILAELSRRTDHRMPVKELDDLAKASGFTDNSVREAKKQLKDGKKVKIHKTGYKEAGFVIELFTETDCET